MVAPCKALTLCRGTGRDETSCDSETVCLSVQMGLADLQEGPWDGVQVFHAATHTSGALQGSADSLMAGQWEAPHALPSLKAAEAAFAQPGHATLEIIKTFTLLDRVACIRKSLCTFLPHGEREPLQHNAGTCEGIKETRQVLFQGLLWL